MSVCVSTHTSCIYNSYCVCLHSTLQLLLCLSSFRLTTLAASIYILTLQLLLRLSPFRLTLQLLLHLSTLLLILQPLLWLLLWLPVLPLSLSLHIELSMELGDFPLELLELIINFTIPNNWKYYSEGRLILNLSLVCSKSFIRLSFMLFS